MEEIEDGINFSTKIFDYWIKNFKCGKGRYTWNYRSTSTKKTTGRTDGVDVRSSRSDNGTNFERGSKYSESEVTSYSLKDFEGNTLIESQQEYFKDSTYANYFNNLEIEANMEGIKREISKEGLTEREAQKLVKQFRKENVDTRRGQEDVERSGRIRSEIQAVCDAEKTDGGAEENEGLSRSLKDDTTIPSI